MASRLMRIILLVCYVVYLHASVIHSEVPDQIVQPSQNPYHASLPGIHLESGSVSVLVPDESNKFVTLDELDVVKGGFLAKIKAFAPKVIKSIVKSVGKVAVVGIVAITVAASLIAIAVGFTTVLCKYTNLCVIELNAPGYANQVLEEVARAYATPDNLASLSKFVTGSIEKFEKFTRKNKKSNKLT